MRLRPQSPTDLLIAFMLLAGLFLLAQHLGGRWLDGDTVDGPAFAVDGDTLEVRGTRVRLSGIDAPELRQTCGAAESLWPCGEVAHKALQKALAGGTVQCAGQGHDQYRRLVAICTVGEDDVAEDLVREGLALSAGRYGASELEARVTRRGLWAGPFERPAEWRAAHPR
ncbi:hypothetical protein GCM10007301_55560 [Azorhizobium oxalatiphilum]|uniref:TNase-like domain-containing protein n=1 Tax=Azorhizobium oxalatiphilum TaxID=980631 RepID=A0A917CI65_9HYPH|nr:thermonuclease family protein [Azorhizobium oxalatiphilum]GGF88515.1 hypothetical protein GCM10007301_55560 [Azorhizobium oxalatiphilum]